MADEQVPLLKEQEAYGGQPNAPPPQTNPYDGQPQAPPPQGNPAPYGGQPQAPPPQAAPYGGQAPPPQAAPYGGQAPPSYQNAPPPAATNATTVHVVQPNTGSAVVQYGENPAFITCPNCHQQQRTVVNYTAGLLTFLLVGVLFIFGFWLCCWIPLLIDGCKDVNHVCPNCHYTVGTYKRL